MKSKNRPNFFLCAALVLLCLVLISTHFTSGLYARYTTKVQGSDNAGIAAFRVSAELSEGSEQSAFTVDLYNKSEVAVSYSLEVTLTDAAYADMISGVELNEVTKSFVNGKALFENVGVLAPGTQTASEVLLFHLNEQFTGTSDSTPDQSNQQTENAQYTAPFTVRAVFTQVD